jgi:hypothetical protein
MPGWMMKNLSLKPGGVFATQFWHRAEAVIQWISFVISEAVIRIRRPCSDTAVFSNSDAVKMKTGDNVLRFCSDFGFS